LWLEAGKPVNRFSTDLTLLPGGDQGIEINQDQFGKIGFIIALAKNVPFQVSWR
jgi:hypothetical protein